jgi:hypothetical protein
MSAAELLCNLAGIKPSNLTREENFIIEAELFTRLLEKLKDYYKNEYASYLRIVKTNRDMEVAMFESNFISCIIKDILSTEEYTLSGIAYYTGTPEEIVYDIAMGNNTSPSANLLRKIIELHRSVRSDLYRSIIEKILSEYLNNSSL